MNAIPGARCTYCQRIAQQSRMDCAEIVVLCIGCFFVALPCLALPRYAVRAKVYMAAMCNTIVKILSPNNI